MNDLEELLASHAWRTVVRPALQQGLRNLEYRLAVDTTLRTKPETLTEFQERHRLLRRLLEEPSEFISDLGERPTGAGTNE